MSSWTSFLSISKMIFFRVPLRFFDERFLIHRKTIFLDSIGNMLQISSSNRTNICEQDETFPNSFWASFIKLHWIYERSQSIKHTSWWKKVAEFESISFCSEMFAILDKLISKIFRSNSENWFFRIFCPKIWMKPKKILPLMPNSFSYSNIFPIYLVYYH